MARDLPVRLWLPLSKARDEVIAAYPDHDAGEIEDALLAAFQDGLIRVRGGLSWDTGKVQPSDIDSALWLTVPGGAFVQWSDGQCRFNCQYKRFDHEADWYEYLTDETSCNGKELEAAHDDLDRWLAGAHKATDAPAGASKKKTQTGGNRSSKRRRWPWPEFELHLECLLDEHGDIYHADEEWGSLADVERIMTEWCDTNWGDAPAESRLRERINEVIERWRQRRQAP